MVQVTADLHIPDEELTFTTSRSGGPGGQNVNKVNTRVTLLFDVAASPSLSESARARLLERLPGRINREGVMRVSSQRHRTQLANKQAAVSRFADLVRAALDEAPERVPVSVPQAAAIRRLEEKHRRGAVKRGRKPVSETEE
jgi:ribosome-associated protein